MKGHEAIRVFFILKSAKFVFLHLKLEDGLYIKH